MLEAIEKAQKFAARFDGAAAFFQTDDQLYFHASTHLLLAIGEESKKLEDGLKLQFPDVPWKLIAGMRNRLAHDYRGIDFELVYSVVQQELPKLKQSLVEMLSLISFDEGEFEAALNSPFYNHLNYLKTRKQ